MHRIPPGPRPTTTLLARRHPLASPDAQREALAGASMGSGPGRTGDFAVDVAAAGWTDLRPAPLEVFQVNLGKLCNMTCQHCHVDAGPDRLRENMDRATAAACVDAIDRLMESPASALHTVDLTGGAPELNPHFEYLVDAAVERGLHVIDRCNLTILLTGPYRHLPAWLAERAVEIACSLPHYRRPNTDAQRGAGAFDRSIEALRVLNAAGYGHGDPGRRLTIVTNPVGAFPAPDQSALEPEWKRELARLHGVTFDRLIALTNMPVSRYLEWLLERGLLETYLQRLLAAFNPSVVAGVMCRNTLSVGWDGRLYDCDFNQQLDMPAGVERAHVSDFDPAGWHARRVVTGRHCYGCTAGPGSSCGGAIVGERSVSC